MTQTTDDFAPHEPSQDPQEEPADQGGVLGLSLDSLEDNFLDQPWFRNYLGLIVTSLVCLAVVIIWPYYCKQQLKEVSTLEKQITDIRYRSLITTAALIEYERVGNILQELDEHQLPLIPPAEPPYLLIDSGQYTSPSPSPASK